MGMAVIEGRAISPDVLPVCGHTTWAGEGCGGRGSVFLEEAFIREVIAEPVRPSEQRLGGVKNAGAAKGVTHRRPRADARAK